MSKKGWLIIVIYVVILLVAAGVLFGKKIFPQEKFNYRELPIIILVKKQRFLSLLNF